MKARFLYVLSIVLFVYTFSACRKDIQQDACGSLSCNAKESCFEGACYVNLQDTFFGLAEITDPDTSLSNLPMYFYINNDSISNIYAYILHIDIDSVLEIHLIRQTTLQNDAMYIDELIGSTHLYGDIFFDNNYATVNGNLQTEFSFFSTGQLTFSASR